MPSAILSDAKIKATIAEYQKNNHVIAYTARNMGISRKTVAHRLKRAVERGFLDTHLLPQGNTSPGPHNKKYSTTKSYGLSEAEIRRKHDTVFKIREAAEALTKGRFLPEADFIGSLNLKAGYKTIVERQEFEKYRGKAPGGLVYWGHPESILKLKTDRVLS